MEFSGKLLEDPEEIVGGGLNFLAALTAEMKPDRKLVLESTNIITFTMLLVCWIGQHIAIPRAVGHLLAHTGLSHNWQGFLTTIQVAEHLKYVML